MKNKLMLIIIDGFGLRNEVKGNAIKVAKTPNLDKLFSTKSWTKLKCSGNSVGLPEGTMGNSEVGHLNIGAGRIVYQNITRINLSIKEKSFFENDAFEKTVEHCKIHKSNLHLFGLLSDGCVHSSLEHLWALLKLAKKNNLKKVYLHAFMDGRDTQPNDGIRFIKEFEAESKKIGLGKIASISGRYYAMDRDNRWERIEKTYQAIVFGNGNAETNTISVMEKSYENGITDEFVIPTIIEKNGKPVAIISDNDAIIFFNFRADRARQLTNCFVNPNFKKFKVRKFHNLFFTTITEYDIKLNKYLNVAFKPIKLTNILGEVLQNNGLKQLRIAETEKYAHITFFFNGGVEKPFKNEDRILVPSPKVATYDLQPEMNAYLVADKVIEKINSQRYDVIILNFANCDMVGHTGVFEAAVKAVEAVDKSVAKVVAALEKNNYNYIITADHGNSEKMLDENGNVFTAHTKNRIPLLISLNDKTDVRLKNDGKLADIAPTILDILDINKPEEMTGKSLIKILES
ncbi:MAG: 2,3-bisphosphoglycerate-independent phosphoglycerate mutase [Candidatus Cloacimonetes bacterium]|nr:2,3-bisphosphoglycerate-independent phosphoglycerate mutase [Candidatus Cloacimonadota bacterium]